MSAVPAAPSPGVTPGTTWHPGPHHTLHRQGKGTSSRVPNRRARVAAGRSWGPGSGSRVSSSHSWGQEDLLPGWLPVPAGPPCWLVHPGPSLCREPSHAVASSPRLSGSGSPTQPSPVGHGPALTVSPCGKSRAADQGARAGRAQVPAGETGGLSPTPCQGGVGCGSPEGGHVSWSPCLGGRSSAKPGSSSCFTLCWLKTLALTNTW